MKNDQSNPRSEAKVLDMGPKLVRNKLQNRAFIIPSLITSVGVFCGFLAILSILSDRLVYATGCIGLAFILDGLDGRVARKLNATSEFGKELDSLSDITAFGVAPAVLLYTWAYKPLALDIGVPLAFLFLVCGATRLARFNVAATEGKGEKGFEGLPIPAAAAAIASLVYFQPDPIGSHSLVIAVAGYSLILSLLMVSSIDYKSPKYLKLANINPAHVLILISATVALAWYNSRLVFATGFFLYVISGPIFAIAKKISDKDIDSTIS